MPAPPRWGWGVSEQQLSKPEILLRIMHKQGYFIVDRYGWRDESWRRVARRLCRDGRIKKLDQRGRQMCFVPVVDGGDDA